MLLSSMTYRVMDRPPVLPDRTGAMVFLSWSKGLNLIALAYDPGQALCREALCGRNRTEWGNPIGEVRCGLHQLMGRITHPSSGRSDGRATATSGGHRL